MTRLIKFILLILIIPLNLIADLNEGLVAHWTFDRPDGITIIDSSVNGFHGTSYNCSYSEGVIGDAIVFDREGDRVYFPDSAMAPSDLISELEYGSISVWFKFKSLGAYILPILYFGETDTSQKHNSLIIEVGHANNAANRKLYFTIINQRFCYDSGENLSENTWYNFIAVVSPEGNTGYLNGKEMTGRHYNLGSDESYTDFFNSVSVKKMLSVGYGRFGQDDRFFTYRGSIDDLRIYNRPLTADEAEEIYSMAETELDLSIPTYENVSYGPHSRNVIDFWQADSDSPTPVVTFIHGGGFISGDKTQARSGRNLEHLKKCLDNGVSFAAINYRFRDTARLDTIMLDCARAFQFVRSKAEEWNIDKEKFASYGGSAGGGATIWLAFNDDLADPANPDPVLRESTRLTVAGHLNSQASYDFVRWPEIVGVDEAWMDSMRTYEDLALYHIDDRSQYYDPDIIKLREFLDMPVYIDKSDPPMYFESYNANTEPKNSGAVIHHPRHPIYLKNIYDELGLESVIVLRDTPIEERVDMIDFFLKHLLESSDAADNYKDENELYTYPNPVIDRTEIHFSIENPGFAKIQLYDAYGRAAGGFPLNKYLEKGEHSLQINLEHLDNGLYFIIVNTSLDTKTLKLIKI